jgi:hypothetical protein|tara:strand:+ start:639 stop:1232 length:594 start_codon:yes stop_codon:yes gene_type:complete
MAITNGYATLQEVKSVLRLTDEVDDGLLDLCIESASRLIDGHCERIFYSTSEEVRYFFARSSFECSIDDLVSLTTLETAPNGTAFDQTWVAAEYQLEPLNGYASGIYMPSNLIRAIDDLLFPTIGEEALVKVTGVFGWSSLPIAIKQATIMQATRLYKRYDSPLGVLGFGDLGVVRISRVDPDIGALLMPYRRIRFA